MKKTISILLALLCLFTFFSCEEPQVEVKTYTVTIDYGFDEQVKVLKEQTKLVQPEAPTRDGYVFAGWTLDDALVTEWNTPLTKDVKLVASWKEIVRVKDIKDIPNAPFVNSTTDGYKYLVGELDGTGYIVENWQDIWTNGDLTIKNLTFEQGLSLHTRDLKGEVTLKIDNCTVYACDQEVIIKALQEKPIENFRMANSGDGLCLGIDTDTSGPVPQQQQTVAQEDESKENDEPNLVNVIVTNSKFIGANDKDEGFGSYIKTEHALAGTNKTDPRGRGVSIGLAAGNTKYLKSALVDGNTFEGIKCGGVQLFKIAKGTDITVSNNNFKSWGINSVTIYENKKDFYAVRGEVLAKEPGSIKLENNTYAESSRVEGDTRNLHNYRVGINGWNQNQDGSYDQSKAE